jgi:GntR family transcriptional regulator / MocR family aminotransferase
MSRSKTSSALELLIPLRRDDPTPLHQQLERELRSAIRSGRLEPESALPSTRALASQLSLSRGVVVEAYEQLVAEGYLVSRHGGTTRVAPRVVDPTPAADGRPDRPAIRIDFAYGRPDVTEFPRESWLRSLRRVLIEAPSERLSYLDHRGAPELREALAAYLNRVRGTVASADRIVICNGFAQALHLTAQLFTLNGARRIAVEEPGQQEAAVAARWYRLDTVPVPVGDDGIRVDHLAATDADAVVVTPAHHFPTGAVLSAAARAALVRWAVARNAVIVEDDYDAEYRYDREPIGAIQGLAPEHVLYAGSASKTLAPGLRLGWVVVPARFVDQLAELKEASDRGSPSLEQLAFADFLSRGEFDRHLRRMRPLYRRRRDALLEAIARELPEARPTGASAGLHVAAWLPEDVDDTAVVAHAADLGVELRALSAYAVDRSRAASGLLFGYGTVTEAQIADGVALVARALAETRGRGAAA